VAGINNVKLWNLSLEVEGEVRTSYGEEDDVEGDDKHKDNDGNAVPFVDQTISIQILQWYLRRMNRRGKAIVRAWTGDF
jgi:hypothetical protein